MFWNTMSPTETTITLSKDELTILMDCLDVALDGKAEDDITLDEVKLYKDFLRLHRVMNKIDGG